MFIFYLNVLDAFKLKKKLNIHFLELVLKYTLIMADKYKHKNGAEKRKIWSEKELQLSSRDPKQTKLNFF